jgi:hypothetical protein
MKDDLRHVSSCDFNLKEPAVFIQCADGRISQGAAMSGSPIALNSESYFRNRKHLNDNPSRTNIVSVSQELRIKVLRPEKQTKR